MSKMIWPPEKTFEYEFNELSKENSIEIPLVGENKKKQKQNNEDITK